MARENPRLAVVPRVLGESTLELIGNTPLLRFRRITRDLGDVQVLAKAEWVNPGGSVKDRAASSIVAEAMREGTLAGKSLLDSTSGNTGIAYAMLGAVYGFPVTLCLPANVSPERKRILHAYGTRMIFTDAGEGSDGAIRKARELAAAEPHRYFYADQYSNPGQLAGALLRHGEGNLGARPSTASPISSPCLAPAELSSARRAASRS